MSTYDDASLILIPSGVKAGKVYSAKPTNGDGDMTFTRASEASRVNSAGLIEKVRTNLFTESNNFSDSDWNAKSGTFTQGVEDPNGGNDAWSWTSTNTDPFLYQSGKSVSGVGTLSIWVKGVGSTIGKNFELRNASPPYKNVVLTGEWQRAEHFNSTASGTSVGFEYGNPAVLGDVVHIYQAQYEYGLVATEYIATTGAAVSVGPVANMPRLDYSGGATCPSLLLEPQRTNIMPSSEDIDSVWSKLRVSVENNNTSSPEGFVNAGKVTATAVSGTHASYDTVNGSVIAGNDYFISCFVKKATTKYIWLNEGYTNGYVLFNFDDQTTSLHNGASDVLVEEHANGWYRLGFKFTADSTGNSQFALFLIDDNNNSSFTGSGEAVYLWGAQIEAGSYATSYIPTYGTAATRVVETCLSSSVSTSVDFTVFFEAKDFCLINGGTTTGYADIQFVFGAAQTPYDAGGSYHIYSNSLYYYNGSANTSFGLVFNNQNDSKFALVKRGNKGIIYANGVKKTEITLPSGADAKVINWDTINLTQSLQDAQADVFGSKYQQLLKFDTALSDSELETLTTL